MSSSNGRADRPRRRLSPRLLVLLASAGLVLVAAPSLILFAAARDAGWAGIAGLASLVIGMFAGMQALVPGRNPHGTAIWQNDIPPGGGGGM